MTERDALIRRLEEGEVGRKIDVAIMDALATPQCNIDGSADFFIGGRCVRRAFEAHEEWPVSTCLNAAVALVERVRPGWYWDVSKVFPSGNMRAGLNPPPVQHGEHWLRDIGAIAFSSTPASALVAALLRSEG